MPFPETVARLVTHHKRGLALASVLVALASVAVVIFAVRFDSEIVNLLPAKFDSVQALKIYDREFEQSRELLFAVQDLTGDEDLDAFLDHFVEQLRAEPWVLRVMAGSPMESPRGLEDLQSIGVPLLLNLPPDDFAQAIATLDPDAIRTRIARIRRDLEAGSPRAQMELAFDPLGPLSAALAPLSGTFTLENAEPLASPDGSLRLIQVVTNQTDLATRGSRDLMTNVNAFLDRMRAEAQRSDNPAPKLMVTGRAAYVAEMSQGMERDIIMTLSSSIALVSLVFYIGFRRVRPLFGILHTLLLSCVIAIAIGGLFLHELNLITIGFCSILVGLGVDFGMLLFGAYQSERDHGVDHEPAIAAALRRLGSAVAFGAGTTAAAFLCLLRSDSAGFAQLGVLIAIGISVAALLMASVFFLFAGSRHKPRKNDVVIALTTRGVDLALAHWKAIALASGIPLLALCIYAFSPIGVLHFEANPETLEPADSKAGEALRAIKKFIPAAKVEPVLVLLHSESPAAAERSWPILDQHWRELKASGEIAGFTSPAPFVMSAERQRKNASVLLESQIQTAQATLADAINAHGFTNDAFASAFRFLDNLLAAARGDERLLHWRSALPADSPWWFLLDRYFSGNPAIAAAYITPTHPIDGVEPRDQLRDDLQVPGVRLYISGWSYTLADLIPWSKSKLVELSILMVVVNAVLLLFHVRSAVYLAILMASLVLATGALIACLKAFNISLHLFNVLAFPLVLGVGVDYGIYVILAVRESGDLRKNLIAILRPVILSGMTTVCGFASLGLAQHPALAGLGIVCGLGIAWCVVITAVFTLPACLWTRLR